LCCIAVVCFDKSGSGSKSLSFVRRNSNKKKADDFNDNEDRVARRRGSFTPAYDKNLHLDMPPVQEPDFSYVAKPVPALEPLSD
jgi:hypothetical protein